MSLFFAQDEHPRKRMLIARRPLKGPLRGPHVGSTVAYVPATPAELKNFSSSPIELGGPAQLWASTR
jgi:hypothetical protein